ncbi:MAG: 3-isopropylmalate dehydrogenase [Arcobacteraceae bacterium]
MNNYNISLIKGDGIGPEIIDEAVKVLNTISKICNFTLEYKEYLMGGIAIDTVGIPLPEETVTGVLNSDACLFGAIGGQKWDRLSRELRPESGLLNFREQLGVYANFRPAVVYEELLNASTLKPHIIKDCDIMVVRELIGGIYFGQPRGNDGKQAYNTMAYTKDEILRIGKKAFELAMSRDKKICSVDKANVLDVSQLWRETMIELAVEYPEVELTHMYIDNAVMQLVRNPKQFDVIVTGNIFGDILSDAASMVVGSIGLLPSASLGDKTAIYEPIHGSAPDISGQGIANPIATLESAAMMLQYSLNEEKAALIIQRAIKAVLKDGYRTKDIALFDAKKILTTSEMGDIITEYLYKFK